MAVGAQQAKILLVVVVGVSVHMIYLEWDEFSQPLSESAAVTDVFAGTQKIRAQTDLRLGVGGALDSWVVRARVDASLAMPGPPTVGVSFRLVSTPGTGHEENLPPH